MPIDCSGFAFPKPSEEIGPEPRKKLRPKPKQTRVVADKSGQGKRLVLSKSDWSKLRRHYWATHQDIKCGICGEAILAWKDFELDHIEPRGMGGGRRDDWKLQPSHSRCNQEKASRRNFKL